MARIVTTAYRYKRPSRKRKAVALEGPAVVVALMVQLCLSPTPATAELPPGPYMILANGQITCGEFLTDNTSSQTGDTEWVLGYISGRNVGGKQTAGTSFTRGEPVLIWLQNYCRSHPFNRLVQAAEGLRDEFLRQEQPLAPKP